MTRQRRIWHIRLAFEPNRFSSNQLEKVYERLKPTESRPIAESSQARVAATKRRAIKRGDR
jgi:hypothetical protein